MALTDNLVAYWRLDESSGNAIDQIGSNDLTETDGTIDAASGPGTLSGARDFEAADTEYFEIADNSDVSTGDIDFTFAGWVNFESTGFRQMVLCKGQANSAPNLEYAIWVENSTDLKLTVSNGTVSADSPNFTVSASTWYFFVAWHDSVNNEIGLWVNNSAAGSPTSYSSGCWDSAKDFQLGGLTTIWPLDGLLSHIGFWKRVLTADERTTLYNSGNGHDPTAAGGGGSVGHRIIGGGWGGRVIAANWE